MTAFLLLAWGAGRHQSTTIDEPAHIAVGYHYWMTGHFGLDFIHPPLARLWAAIPLLFETLRPFYPPPAWVIEKRITLGDWLLNENLISHIALRQKCRAMMMLASLFLPFLVWRWAKEVWGDLEALVAVAFLVTCPVILAYAPLVGNDLPATTCFMFTLYAFWRFARAPSSFHAAVTGTALGMALMVKFNNFLLFPILLVLALSELKKFRAVWLASFMGSALLVIFATYRFQDIGRLPQGLFELSSAMSDSADQYFRGRNNGGSPWWWFFSVCYILKTPLSFLGMGVLGVYLAAKKEYPRVRTALVWFLIPAFLYLMAVSGTKHQYGIRRVLFLYPLLALWSAGAWGALWRRGIGWRWTAVGLLSVQLIIPFIHYPLFFSYLNACVPSTQKDYYLVDCNLDWGQGLGGLGTYLKTNGAGAVFLAYVGAGHPHDYGIRYWCANPFASSYIRETEDRDADPRKEKKVILAVSSALVRANWDDGTHPFQWLESRRPLAIVMDSIYVYDITADPEAIGRLTALSRR